MLKKVITYTDFNGDERTETLWFNISKSELVDAMMSKEGDYAEMLQRIVAERDKVKLYTEFKSFVLKAYGEKSEDGRRFVKSPEIRAAFEQSAAFDAFFVEIFSDEKAAAEFINGLLPKDLRQMTKDTAALPEA